MVADVLATVVAVVGALSGWAGVDAMLVGAAWATGAAVESVVVVVLEVIGSAP